MIKAKGKGPDGRTNIVMGISEENVRRLKLGQPIYYDPAQLGFEHGEEIGGFVLFYGKDDAALTNTLQGLIGPETIIHVVPKGDPRPQ